MTGFFYGVACPKGTYDISTGTVISILPAPDYTPGNNATSYIEQVMASNDVFKSNNPGINTGVKYSTKTLQVGDTVGDA